MNATHFLEWFEKDLIPNLKNKSCIVLDNAPYHNTKVPESDAPNMGNRKSVLIDWLKERNIKFDEKMVKRDLNNLVKLHKTKPIYKTDQLAESKGHVVLRLPVKHCEFNPIELIQGQEKQYVAQRNTTFKLKDVKQLFIEAKQQISVQDWKNVVNHVIQKVENKFWEMDNVQAELNERIIIDCFSDSDTDSDLECDSDCSHISDDEMDIDLESHSGLEDEISESEESEADIVCFECDSREAPLPANRKNIPDTDDWIFCNFCDHWFHVECNDNIKCSSEIAPGETYACDRCARKVRNEE